MSEIRFRHGPKRRIFSLKLNFEPQIIHQEKAYTIVNNIDICFLEESEATKQIMELKCLEYRKIYVLGPCLKKPGPRFLSYLEKPYSITNFLKSNLTHCCAYHLRFHHYDRFTS